MMTPQVPLLTLDQEELLRRQVWYYLMTIGHPVTAPEIVGKIDGYPIPYSRATRVLSQLVGLGFAKKEFMTYSTDKNGRKVTKWFYTGIDGVWPEVEKELTSRKRHRE
jgi:hypothetical protein